MKPIVIGLYGGVGAGKDLVANEFRYLGADILDADAEVTKLYTEASIRNAVKKKFGDVIVGDRVDRKALAQKIFTNPDARHDLEAILHPPIHERFQQRIASVDAPEVIILNVPLLFGSKMESLVAVGVFIDDSEEIREDRVIKYRGWKPGELARRDAAQPPLSEKRKRCAYIVDNNKTPEEVERQVRAIWKSVTTFK